MIIPLKQQQHPPTHPQAALAITVYYVCTTLVVFYVRSASHIKSMWFALVANTILWFAYLKALIRATVGRLFGMCVLYVCCYQWCFTTTTMGHPARTLTTHTVRTHLPTHPPPKTQVASNSRLQPRVQVPHLLPVVYKTPGSICSPLLHW